MSAPIVMSAVEEIEGGDANYRSVCISAIFALVLGVLSAVAVWHIVLVAVPLLGILVALFALRRISLNSETLIGRPLALGGVFLAVFFLGMGGIRHQSRHLTVIREAQAFSLEFMDYLRHDEPHKAHQMLVAPAKRSKRDERLWQTYEHNVKLNQDLHEFIKQPATRAVIAAGKDAVIRPYLIEEVEGSGPPDSVTQVFAVTFTEQGKPRTFFVRMTCERRVDPDVAVLDWQLSNVRAPYLPAGF